MPRVSAIALARPKSVPRPKTNAKLHKAAIAKKQRAEGSKGPVAANPKAKKTVTDKKAVTPTP